MRDPTRKKIEILPKYKIELYRLAKDKNEQFFKLLIKNNADKDARDESGSTLLHTACNFGMEEAVKLLIEAGADIKAKDFEGRTPLHIACIIDDKNDNLIEKKNIIELLLKANADPNDLDSYHSSPFYNLFLYNANNDLKKEIIDLLIEHKANIDFKGSGGSTLLHLVCNFGLTEVVESLIAANANKNARDENGWTPLHSACANDQDKIAGLLLDANVDKDAKDKNGLSPLFIALYKAIKVKDYIDRDPEGFASFIKVRNKNIIDLLIEHKVDIDSRNKYGFTPLHIACNYDMVEIAKSLIDAKADLNAKEPEGFTPLHIACNYDMVEIAKSLIEAKADLNAKDPKGSNPIHIACEFYHKEIVDLLIEHKADINAKDSKGNTPLHIACEWNQKEIVQKLIDAGADINAKNSEGLTPLDRALDKAKAYSAYFNQSKYISETQNEKIIHNKKIVELLNKNKSSEPENNPRVRFERHKEQVRELFR
jgi:ankyrin repeat protein